MRGSRLVVISALSLLAWHAPDTAFAQTASSAERFIHVSNGYSMTPNIT